MEALPPELVLEAFYFGFQWKRFHGERSPAESRPSCQHRFCFAPGSCGTEKLRDLEILAEEILPKEV